MMVFAFSFYCHECTTRFYYDLSEQPQQVRCPNNHEMGVWSNAGTKEIKCKVCNGKVIGVFHNRLRHDIKTPSGKEILVQGTKEENQKAFEHFTSHPEVLKALIKAGLVKVK